MYRKREDDESDKRVMKNEMSKIRDVRSGVAEDHGMQRVERMILWISVDKRYYILMKDDKTRWMKYLSQDLENDRKS